MNEMFWGAALEACPLLREDEERWKIYLSSLLESQAKPDVLQNLVVLYERKGHLANVVSFEHQRAYLEGIFQNKEQDEAGKRRQEFLKSGFHTFIP